MPDEWESEVGIIIAIKVTGRTRCVSVCVWSMVLYSTMMLLLFYYIIYEAPIIADITQHWMHFCAWLAIKQKKKTKEENILHNFWFMLHERVKLINTPSKTRKMTTMAMLIVLPVRDDRSLCRVASKKMKKEAAAAAASNCNPMKCSVALLRLDSFFCQMSSFLIVLTQQKKKWVGNPAHSPSRAFCVCEI